MKVTVLQEEGFNWAMLGLSLNKNQPVENMGRVADKLAPLDDGHNKFLETIVVWLDITAPRYWWQEFDTYRVGVTKQSQSTMHTITKKPLCSDDFEGGMDYATLSKLNGLVELGDWVKLKRALPESFLQRRIVCTNYKVLRHIYKQRHNHKLQEWKLFCFCIRFNLDIGQWITVGKMGEE